MAEESVPVGVRLPKRLVEEVDREAKRMADEHGHSVSRTDAVQALLTLALRERRPQKKKRAALRNLHSRGVIMVRKATRARPAVRIVRDGGAEKTLYYDGPGADGELLFAVHPEGVATFRYSFCARTGEALSPELQVECEGETVAGKRVGDLRQLTMFDAPSVYTTQRRKTKRVAIWRLAPGELERVKEIGR